MSKPPCWKLECLCCVFHLVKSDRVCNHRLVTPYLTSCRLTRRQGFKKAQPFNQEQRTQVVVPICSLLYRKRRGASIYED